jgi:hypothetical protein
MFLPRLLIERFGWPGFIAFAVPNIVGVVAFGYVVGSAARSRRLIEEHGRAMRWFSIVTIAYHVFFLVVVASFMPPEAMPDGAMARSAIAAGPFIAALLLGSCSGRTLLWAAAGSWLASMAAFVGADAGLLATVQWSGRLTTGDLALLSPILALGFMLCPLLDLTFHRAIAESPSRHAFIIFAPAFAIMLVLTCVMWSDASMGWRSLLFGHLLWQSTITMALHLRELRAPSRHTTGVDRAGGLLAPLVGAVIGIAAIEFAIEEATYIRHLVAYGLVFPTYVMVFIAPRVAIGRTRRSLAMFTVVVLMLAPLYELGFISEQMGALAVPAFAAVAWCGLRTALAPRASAMHSHAGF